MDKDWKLQRYQRKDYTEVVDFPVEIVGRDGVVRRYSFEDSIRLYQRRITFAPIRYRDIDLVQAEVGHCRSRIDQLRRSYFHRFGWGTPEGQPGPDEVFGDLAGELAAFICRVLRCDGRPEVKFDCVAEEVDGVSTWYVTPLGAGSGMLLYVHRFQGPDADRVREGFFTSLKSLERTGRVQGDGERLLAFHHTVDCGFVLSGRGAEFAALVQCKEDDEDEFVDESPTPWDEVLDIIRRGDYDVALTRCQAMTREQPWHRSAYIAGAMLAAHLGQFVLAEELALVGSRYFPADALIQYQLGLARLRQDRMDEAEVHLRKAIEIAPSMVAARGLLVAELIQHGRLADARVILDGLSEEPDDRRLGAELLRLRRRFIWRQVMVGSGLLTSILGASSLFLLGAIGLVPIAGGAVLAAGGHLAFRRHAEGLLGRLRLEEVSQGLRRLNRRTVGAPLIS